MNSLCVYKEKIINKTYNTYKPNLDLLSKNLFRAKSGDSASMIFFIEKYQLLIKKYAYAYKLKNYDTDDLIQIGNLSVITAINKYDLTRGAEYIDSYIINSIKNSFKNLARGQIKYNDESSINITINEDIEISDLIIDSFKLEDHVIKSITNTKLKKILSNLTSSEQELIRTAYFIPQTNLFKHCKNHGLNYSKKRRELLSLLSKIRTLLDL